MLTLLERLVRVVASTGLASNPGPHQYGMNDFTKSLADPTQHSAIRYWYDINIPLYTAFPAYLAHNDYKNPSGTPASTVFNWAKNHTGTLFEYYNQHPKQEADFARCMTGYAGNLTPWTEIYPTDELVAGGPSDDVVLVDVGGSVGHDISLLQAKHSLGPGRLVLQDQAAVIEEAHADSSITAMVHDFLTPQPVKGTNQL